MVVVNHYTGDGDVSKWLAKQTDLLDNKSVSDVVRAQYLLERLSPQIRAALESDGIKGRLERETSCEKWVWTCRNLTAALIGMQSQIRGDTRSVKETLKEFYAENPMFCKVAAGVGVATGCLIGGPLVLFAGLEAVGFTSVGVAAGSVAAGAQSAIFGGAVSAGSWFAFCQSLAMGGAAATGVATAAIGTTAVAAGAAAANAIPEGGHPLTLPPSKSWNDGENFRPTEALIQAILEASKLE